MANKCHNSLLARLSNGYEAPTYSSVTLSNPTNRTKAITSSLFRANSSLSHLTLSNCIFNNVLLRNCIIRNGILHHCILFDCDIKNSVVKHCQVIKAPLALRRFAPEIRGLIFEHAIPGGAPDGKIPPLVKALRGDQVLYGEAIEAFYKKSWIPLSYIERMKPVDIQLITKVVIDPAYDCNNIQGTKILLAHAKNVQELDLPWVERGGNKAFISRFSHLSVLSVLLRTVERVSIMFPCTLGWSHLLHDPQAYEGFIDYLGDVVDTNTITSVRYNGCFAKRVLQAKSGMTFGEVLRSKN